MASDERIVSLKEARKLNAKPNGKGNGHGPTDGGLGGGSGSVGPPEFSDDALALIFAQQRGVDWRYVDGWGRWHNWDGAHWRFDDTLLVHDIILGSVCRAQALKAEFLNKKNVPRSLASAKTMQSVERIARGHRTIAATVDQWDADRWLLGTPAGTVDLRAGKMRQARREDYITRLTAVAPSRSPCPLWLAFLERVTGGDADLQGFLQRMAGYALTGVTIEHALFFFYGTGSNGKGTFINTLAGILGGYSSVASMDTFIASYNERHSTDLAMLRGARLVSAQETEEGRRWAEAKLKALTGGDPVTARFMRQDNFTYTPQFKLIIAGNHKPALRNVDPAMRRRFNLVPFTETIADGEIDRGFAMKLRQEWPAILAWAIEGCLLWQRYGLDQPVSVRAATDDYFVAEDSFARWLEEECVLRPDDPKFRDPSQALWKSWSQWCSENGEQPGSQRSLSERLAARGFQPYRTGKERGFCGISARRRAGLPEDPNF
jgi:putative DNA primase/helicase